MRAELIVRVSVPIAGEIAERAKRAGWSFADEVHRILEQSFGLHQGEGIMRGGVVETPIPCWRYKAINPTQVRIRSSIDRELAGAAQAHRWPVAAEVNARLAAHLLEQKRAAVATALDRQAAAPGAELGEAVS